MVLADELTPESLIEAMEAGRFISSREHPNPSEIGEFERAWTQPTKGPAAIPVETP